MLRLFPRIVSMGEKILLKFSTMRPALHDEQNDEIRNNAAWDCKNCAAKDQRQNDIHNIVPLKKFRELDKKVVPLEKFSKMEVCSV